MEYQFTLFDQWVTKMSYGSGALPELKEWEKQLHQAKEKTLKHFMAIDEHTEDKATLQLYINHHYKSLLKLIHDLYLVKDLYKELMLKSLEQIKFFMEMKYASLLVKHQENRITTTLSVEEFAIVINSLIECDVIKVRSKKALAYTVSRYISFQGHEERNISAEHFYNALFLNKSITLNKVLKTIGRVQLQVNKAIKLA